MPVFCVSGCSEKNGPEDTPVSKYASVYSDNANMPCDGIIMAEFGDSPAGSDISKIIDGDPSTSFVTYRSDFDVTFTGNSGSGVNEYSLIASGSEAPKDWTLFGSNNDKDWTELDSQSGQTFSDGETKTYALAGESYKSYRLSVTANNGSSSTAIAEWMLSAEEVTEIRVPLYELPAMSTLIQYSDRNSWSYSDETPMGKHYAGLHVTTDADRAWLAERFDVAEGELKDMLAEVEKSADAFFERTAQDIADVSDLTREYVASVAEYLKDSLRTAAAEARAAQAMFAELETVNEEIASLADDMDMGWIGLMTASNIWDVDDYLADHPDYLMSAELSAAVERAHALLKELAKYGCEPQSSHEAWALGKAIGVFVDLCDEYGDDVLDMIDDVRDDVSAVLTEVGELYQSAKEAVLAVLGDIADGLPGVLNEFELALGEVADFAAAAIDSADDFIAESRRLADAAADKMASLGEAMSVSRDKLTAEQYADVERALIEEYGSLEAWWASSS